MRFGFLTPSKNTSRPPPQRSLGSVLWVRTDRREANRFLLLIYFIIFFAVPDIDAFSTLQTVLQLNMPPNQKQSRGCQARQ